ncbi:hypothetical protein N8E89_23590 (plasmid) [Phyllobacterium sp. A18/5-2]|uniref:hypothetical protein n=1 Tax=Phyllobacterium sp. A18/5-2 TaxID=2978392 RepID=UPI0021C6A440|nr:hypothetical protein [Phyllobacterium sp. A18/5-2]UXN66179.1 hypothetical protein N8E89_23590 [Phyllobacterium sp. A18/5-2]
MREFPFPSVTVMDQFGHTVDSVSVSEAAMWLVAHWPTRSGEQHKKVYCSCQRGWYLHHIQTALGPLGFLRLFQLPKQFFESIIRRADIVLAAKYLSHVVLAYLPLNNLRDVFLPLIFLHHRASLDTSNPPQSTWFHLRVSTSIGGQNH